MRGRGRGLGGPGHLGARGQGHITTAPSRATRPVVARSVRSRSQAVLDLKSPTGGWHTASSVGPASASIPLGKVLPEPKNDRQGRQQQPSKEAVAGTQAILSAPLPDAFSAAATELSKQAALAAYLTDSPCHQRIFRKYSGSQPEAAIIIFRVAVDSKSHNVNNALRRNHERGSNEVTVVPSDGPAAAKLVDNMMHGLNLGQHLPSVYTKKEAQGNQHGRAPGKGQAVSIMGEAVPEVEVYAKFGSLKTAVQVYSVLKQPSAPRLPTWPADGAAHIVWEPPRMTFELAMPAGSKPRTHDLVAVVEPLEGSAPQSCQAGELLLRAYDAMTKAVIGQETDPTKIADSLGRFQRSWMSLFTDCTVSRLKAGDWPTQYGDLETARAVRLSYHRDDVALGALKAGCVKLGVPGCYIMIRFAKATAPSPAPAAAAPPQLAQYSLLLSPAAPMASATAEQLQECKKELADAATKGSIMLAALSGRGEAAARPVHVRTATGHTEPLATTSACALSVLTSDNQLQWVCNRPLLAGEDAISLHSTAGLVVGFHDQWDLCTTLFGIGFNPAEDSPAELDSLFAVGGATMYVGAPPGSAAHNNPDEPNRPVIWDAAVEGNPRKHAYTVMAVATALGCDSTYTDEVEIHGVLEGGDQLFHRLAELAIRAVAAPAYVAPVEEERLPSPPPRPQRPRLGLGARLGVNLLAALEGAAGRGRAPAGGNAAAGMGAAGGAGAGAEAAAGLDAGANPDAEGGAVDPDGGEAVAHGDAQGAADEDVVGGADPEPEQGAGPQEEGVGEEHAFSTDEGETSSGEGEEEDEDEVDGAGDDEAMRDDVLGRRYAGAEPDDQRARAQRRRG